MSTTRYYWASKAYEIAHPVLHALAQEQLRATMPVECLPGQEDGRRKVTHLEAVGRTLVGIAPWLEVEGLEGQEADWQAELRELTIKGLDNATNPESPDYLNWHDIGQPLVDAAFLAHALLRAPTQLWGALPPDVQERLVCCLKVTRRTKPGLNNWLLFAGIIEAFLLKVGAGGDTMRLDYAIRQHELWYRGDGVYGDGADFHFDYYNSFVIQPMLLDCLNAAGEVCTLWEQYEPRIRERAIRYAAVQERMIGPDASFPPVGRSLTYRTGCFQLLAQAALQGFLPKDVLPAQVRCALTAVMHRLLDVSGTFDENGWLKIGFAGAQLSLAEPYISTGSLYLCLSSFLPLGLSPDNEFWAAPNEAWTSQKIFGGEDLPADKALSVGKLFYE